MSEQTDRIRRLEDEVLRQRRWLERMTEIKYDPSGKYLQKMATQAMEGQTYTPPEPDPPMVCSKCGTPEEDTPHGRLFDVQVITCEGEEGYGNVTMMLCDEQECGPTIIEELIKLGFVDHKHGGTDLLQDENCIGAQYNEQHYLKPCPTPTDPYKGTYIVGNWSLSSGREEGEDDDD